MSEPTLALQGAIFAALKDNTAAGANVFDKLTPNVFPRIQIGGGDAVPDDADCVDGWTVNMQLDVWSKGDGYLEAKTIAGEIHALLHKKALAVAGYRLVDIYSAGAVFSRDTDISRARIQVEAHLETA